MSINNLNILPRIKEIYESGGNIIQYLKNIELRDFNSLQDILISYDFQSGEYIKQIEANLQYSFDYSNAIAIIIKSLGQFQSLMEIGVGEATTLVNVLKKLEDRLIKSYGFDISWSRIHVAEQYLNNNNLKSNLFVADLFNIPLFDNSIDVVYTSHSVEPNGGREKEALKELYRITNKYLILLEPTYEFADEAGKERMKKNGYIQNILGTIRELNYNLIEYKKFDISINPLNPTGLYIIKKDNEVEQKNVNFRCPISKELLTEYSDHFFSEKSLISYPKISSIPCLCEFYGILTSKHNYEI